MTRACGLWKLLNCNYGARNDAAAENKFLAATALHQIFAGPQPVAKMFSEGSFNTAMCRHDTTPRGVPTHKKLHAEVHYNYEETATADKIMIATTDPKALKAVDNCLRFQTERQTGDRTESRMMPLKSRESPTDVSLPVKGPGLGSGCGR
jgi:hypothetical protein